MIRLRPATLAGILAIVALPVFVSITTGCGPYRDFEFVNETDGPITLLLHLDVDPGGVSVRTIAPGDSHKTKFSARGPEEQRAEIRDADGVLLLEFAINYELVDDYDGRIVVR